MYKSRVVEVLVKDPHHGPDDEQNTGLEMFIVFIVRDLMIVKSQIEPNKYITMLSL